MAFVVFLRGAGGAYFALFVRQLTDVRPRRMTDPRYPECAPRKKRLVCCLSPSSDATIGSSKHLPKFLDGEFQVGDNAAQSR